MLFDGGGKAVQALDDIEIGLAALATDQAADDRVARAQAGVECSQLCLRLDHHPFPAALVEPERHIVGHGMTGADVEVGAGLLPGEASDR